MYKFPVEWWSLSRIQYGFKFVVQHVFLLQFTKIVQYNNYILTVFIIRLKKKVFIIFSRSLHCSLQKSLPLTFANCSVVECRTQVGVKRIVRSYLREIYPESEESNKTESRKHKNGKSWSMVRKKGQKCFFSVWLDFWGFGEVPEKKSNPFDKRNGQCLDCFLVERFSFVFYASYVKKSFFWLVFYNVFEHSIKVYSKKQVNYEISSQ